MLLKMSTKPLYTSKILQKTFSGPKQPEMSKKVSFDTQSLKKGNLLCATYGKALPASKT